MLSLIVPRWAKIEIIIAKTRLFKYIENVTTQIPESFKIKILIFFNISAKKYSSQPQRTKK